MQCRTHSHTRSAGGVPGCASGGRGDWKVKMFEFRNPGGQRGHAHALARLFVTSALLAALVAGVPASSPAAKGDCSQPATDGTVPKASDCIYILRAAIGLLSCEECVCDANGSASLSAADALMCLKIAVGQNIALKCPDCAPVTTTTTTTNPPGPTSSTTTSSTSSTTSTLPVSCESDAACASLGLPYRCNLFTGNCEKPCNGDKDCKDFLECNANHYCVPPLLLY